METTGSIGILAIGILVGFFIARRIFNDGNLSVTDYVKLIGPFGGGGLLAGLTGFLLQNNLFALLDSYGIGLLAGVVLNVLLRISGTLIEDIGALIAKLGSAMKDISGRTISESQKFITLVITVLMRPWLLNYTLSNGGYITG